MDAARQDEAAGDDRPIEQVIDRLEEVAARDEVRLGDLVESFGSASFLSAMLIPALLVLSPLSGIPLFSSACGITIAAIAAQMIVGCRHLHLPRRLMRIEIAAGRVRGAVGKMRRVARWIDARTRPRLHLFIAGPARKLIQLLCMLCGAAMPFLEIVPFSSSILGLAVILLSTALLARDGIFAALGTMVFAVALAIPYTVITAI